MIQKTQRCFLLAIGAIFPLVLVPFNAPANADSNPKESSDSSTLSSTLKVGETRSQSLARPQADAIAKIHPHQIGGKSAATVYIRNIPVLTFISSAQQVKIAAPQATLSKTTLTKVASKLPSNGNSIEIYNSFDPVERATATAALFNQLARDGFDANDITAVWQSDSYSIKLGDKLNLKLDSSLIMAVSTKNKANDVLESANLLRRLIGNAQPLTKVVGAPVVPIIKVAKAIKPSYSLPIAVVTQVMTGMASWYGPGFHGGTTANGERFNQYTLTAAHPNLPFGTPVRVTNTYNGRSVVVRINDRGPYTGGRVIDLSAGAAQVIGLMSSGVAPVRLEIMRRR